MATATLSFQKRARNSLRSPAWDSTYTSSSGSDLMSADYGYVVVYKFSPYNGNDVKTINNIVFTAKLGGDFGQQCSYIFTLYSTDPSGGTSKPSSGRLASTSGTSSTGSISWTISSTYTSYSTLYVVVEVNYYSGQVTLSHGNSSFVENYTAQAVPQVSFKSVTANSDGMKILINNGSNYTLTCTITASGNNAQLYSGTSSTGEFNVQLTATRVKLWFDTAGNTTSLSIPITITVTGGNPSPITLNGTYTENRTSVIESMKPVVSSIDMQVQQPPGFPQEYASTYIAGYSKCKVTAVITRPTNATVSTVQLSYAGGATVNMTLVDGTTDTYEGTTTAALVKNTSFTVTVTDSRSLSKFRKKGVTGVVAYVLPSVSIDLAYRCDDQEVETDGGDHYRIRVTAQISNNLPNNSIEELTVGLKGAPAVERHIITSGTTSSAFGTLSDPKKAYVITVIIQDKISGQITTEYTLKGKQRDLVLNHDGGYTHLGVGMTPVGKDYSGYKDTIELPNDGLFLMGGIPAQSFNMTHWAGRTAADPCFGKDFLTVSENMTGEANAAAVFSFLASEYNQWSNVPNDPYDSESTPSGIRTKGWSGWREVYFVNQNNVFVKITEIAPKSGRIWFCFKGFDSTTQTYKWFGWKYLMPTSV